jgi:hypothetical protein
MSRSGYTDDQEDQWAFIRYRGAVTSAIRGKRGQAFLREMLASLDAMPDKRLITGALVFDGQPDIPWNPYPHEDVIVGGDQLVTGRGEVVRVGDVCAIGSVGIARGLDMSGVDPHDPPQVSGAFGISEALAREIVYENDEGCYRPETPEQRFERMRNWILSLLRDGSAAVVEFTKPKGAA